MKVRARHLVILALLAAAPLLTAARRASRAGPVAPCVERPFEGARFIVCSYRRQHDELRLAWRDGRQVIGSLPALQRSLGADADRLRFAMNAGMYEPDQSPVGLLVIEGQTLHEANTAEDRGNFYLKPNGVFSADRDGAVRVEETGRFLTRKGETRWATQSGPLLVQDGRLHPAITDNGPSLAIRNGVGVAHPDLAFFAISVTPVSMGRFARFLRDEMGCPDVLYFDGTISSLSAPSLRRRDVRRGLGPLVAVLAKTAPAAARR